ncbi:MAG: hypothetical protein O3A93_09560 [Chloroflexi bacterium]|nr:hypothetical protein [Chloroflexota bacterium]MDA1271491.1 hypothetical protein [Chloroflexota bacterium]PKB58602.1 MAG: hypothetical protein BZY83_05980 [SAR202 cluster bacterium Casp-Chloro-G2]
MTDDFRQRVEAAKKQTKSVTVTESQKRLEANPAALIIETRLRENVPVEEQHENVVFLSVEDLDAQAEDRSKLDPRLADPNVEIITT